MSEAKGQLHVWLAGINGRILTYTRSNGRCPSRDFLDDAPQHLLKRFDRLFARFGTDGMDIADHGSFKPMSQLGKGLWALKEFDHRLLAFRGPDEQVKLPSPVTTAAGPVRTGATRTRQQIVLLCGWVKDKSDSLEERQQVERAQTLREECERCVDWDTVVPTKPPKGIVARVREDLTEPLFTPAFTDKLALAAEEVIGPSVLAPLVEPTMAAKGPAQTPAKPKPEPVFAEPVLPKEDDLMKSVEKATEKPPMVTLQQLADLASVPYQWLWKVVKEGRVQGYTVQTVRKGYENKVWSWDGIEKVVAQVEELRRTGVQGVARDKPTKAASARPSGWIHAPTLQPEPLLTMARVARLVGTSKGELRKAVASGVVKPAEVRDGIRMFRGSDVRKWYEGRGQPLAAVLAPPVLAPPPDIDAPIFPPPTNRILVPALVGPPLYDKPQSKAVLRGWLDELLVGARADTEDFVTAIRFHMEYRKKLERELAALAEG